MSKIAIVGTLIQIGQPHPVSKECDCALRRNDNQEVINFTLVASQQLELAEVGDEVELLTDLISGHPSSAATAVHILHRHSD